MALVNWAYSGPTAAEASWCMDFLKNPPPLVAVDIETVSLADRSVLGIGLAPAPDCSFYIPTNCQDFNYFLMAMDNIICNPKVRKVYHNAMFDLPELDNFGADMDNIVDTIIMAYLLGLPPKLKDLARYLADMDIREWSEVVPGTARSRTSLDVAQEVMAGKCLADVQATYRIYQRMLPNVDQKYLAREMRLLPVLVGMTRWGFRLDQELLGRLMVQYQEQVDNYKLLAEAEGFNPGSNQQVGSILASRGNWLPTTRGGLALKVDERVLRENEDPLSALVLNYRRAAKVLGTYLRPWAGEERAYTHFHLAAATGRVSSTDRNMQNVPTDLRGIFLPDNGVFTDFDFNQQELRVLAHLSQDPEMLWIFDHGLDIHQATADFMRIPRRPAKNVTFAMVYGGDPQTIMETAGIRDLARAKQLRAAWERKYRKAAEWIAEQQVQGLRDGKVYTIQGRTLFLDMHEDEAAIRRKAVNYPIQGSAAEVTKDAMLLTAGMPQRLQVHDELVLDGHVAEEELRGLGLEDVAPFRIPIKVKYVERWE